MQARTGVISGRGTGVNSGEDLVFGPAGALYVTDDFDDELYQVDPATGRITAVFNHEPRAGYSGSMKVEALAFDLINDVLIAADDARELLFQQSLTAGSSTLLGDLTPVGLTDVEGLAFSLVPEPAAVVLLAIGALLTIRRR